MHDWGNEQKAKKRNHTFSTTLTCETTLLLCRIVIRESFFLFSAWLPFPVHILLSGFFYVTTHVIMTMYALPCLVLPSGLRLSSWAGREEAYPF